MGRHLALSRENTVDFTPGMICITGETGAGKSLIVDALALVLGGRADAGVVREGQARCEIAALFSLDDNSRARELLRELDLDQDEPSCLLRRTVSRDGKSRAYINGRAATAAGLREIGAALVSIHGQHASVKLMDNDQQLNLLDSFIGDEEARAAVHSAFNAYNVKRQELTRLSEEQKNIAAGYKMLRYELNELKTLDLGPGDYEQIAARFDQVMHQAQLTEALALGAQVLESEDHNVLELIRTAFTALDHVKKFDEKRIAPILDELNNALMALTDARELTADLLQSLEAVTPLELERRLSRIHELARRFGVDPSQLYLKQQELEARMERFAALKDEIAGLTEVVRQLRADYETAAARLSDIRCAGAKGMAERVTALIRTLAMPDGVFEVKVSVDHECKPRSQGRDGVEFLFTANFGQEVKPLGAVASGGELSRLALAIEALTSSNNSTPTIIFDEVDTGISGRTASAVGELLSKLGRDVQVITITHLPQVAARADTHFLVSKCTRDGEVSSYLELLDHQGRVEELARMMGGTVVTAATRQSAEQLLADR